MDSQCFYRFRLKVFFVFWKFYKENCCLFIRLAVGTLTGTGIFHLIPMAFDVESFDHHMSYLNKGLLAIIIIYLFYIRDQLCGLFFPIDTVELTKREKTKESLSFDFIRSFQRIIMANKTKAKINHRSNRRIIEI